MVLADRDLRVESEKGTKRSLSSRELFRLRLEKIVRDDLNREVDHYSKGSKKDLSGYSFHITDDEVTRIYDSLGSPEAGVQVEITGSNYRQISLAVHAPVGRALHQLGLVNQPTQFMNNCNVSVEKGVAREVADAWVGATSS